VAGIDEVSARSVLADMQARLARDPAAALGVTSTATPEELRAAFLQLTKQFHPVRFGRMTSDIQKLSNEVFLALRAAHDALAKSLRRQSGPVPIARSASASGAAPSLPVPPVPVASGSGVRPPQSGSRTTRPAPNEAAGPPPPAIPITPSSAKAGARGTGPANVPRAPAPAAARPGSGPTAAPRDEAAVLDLLSRQQWDQARSALHQLQAREPTSKKIRALMCYARGREAQLAGQVDDARVELQDALDLDPDLQLAKTALTELFTRRK
jgi:curved DNA-binding protein CbpA